MLFNKTISTLIACGTVGATVMSPNYSQAISAFTIVQTEPVQTKWVEEFKQKHPTYRVPLASVYRGQASWYGPGFYGNRTANGEIYRPGTMTAAHRSLPFGTRVRVTNLINGKNAVVRINDRGPYVYGRIIDLGEGAAKYLGVSSTGLAPVRLEVLN